MGAAGAAPEWGVARGLWLNTFARNPGNLKRKNKKKVEGGILKNCEMVNSPVP